MIFTLPMELGAIGLFLITILSASIFPLPSEPAVVAAIPFLGAPLTFMITLAGWMIGGITNWLIGKKGLHRFVKRDAELEDRARNWFGRWGPIVLVATPWIPFVGDPMNIVAGAANMPFRKFVFYGFIGRIIKAAAFVLLGNALLAWLGVTG